MDLQREFSFRPSIYYPYPLAARMGFEPTRAEHFELTAMSNKGCAGFDLISPTLVLLSDNSMSLVPP